MTKWLCIFLTAICSIGLVSCSDDDDKPDSPKISGPAILQVINNTQYVQEISFDGLYIGDVVAHSYRAWNVPVGRHIINGYDDIYGSSSGSYNFTAGRVTPVTYYLGTTKNLANTGIGVKKSTLQKD